MVHDSNMNICCCFTIKTYAKSHAHNEELTRVHQRINISLKLWTDCLNLHCISLKKSVVCTCIYGLTQLTKTDRHILTIHPM